MSGDLDTAKGKGGGMAHHRGSDCIDSSAEDGPPVPTEVQQLARQFDGSEGVVRPSSALPSAIQVRGRRRGGRGGGRLDAPLF